MDLLMKKLILILLVIICGTTEAALADGESVEAGKLIGLSRAISIYKTMNHGLLPNNWSDIGPYYHLESVNYDLVGTSGYPLEDHYQFIAQPMVLPDMGLSNLDGSQVLLIRTVPLASKADMDSANPQEWRYVIFQGKDGRISSATLSEKDIQLMLKTAGLTITRKAGLPAVEQYERISPPVRSPKQSLDESSKHPEFRSGVSTAGTAPSSNQSSSSQPTSPVAALPTAVPQVSPGNDAGIPWRLYGIVAFILAVLLGVAYFLSRRDGRSR
jgi:hypothetical protein